MALNIIPGYDFAVNEVPTRETLLRQARAMKISGIALEHIDADLIGYKAGTTSGVTSASLPAPGWMWADPGGNVWLETDHGSIKMKRSGGGFESRRWGRTHADEQVVSPPGSPWTPAPADGAATHTDGLSLGNGASESARMWDEGFFDTGAGVGVNSHMWSSESNATGVTYPRLVGRGVTEMFVAGTATPIDNCIRVPAGARVFTTTNSWSGAFVTTASNILGGVSREAWNGMFLAPHSGTSYEGTAPIDMRGTCFGWKFDQAVHGPGAAI